MKRRFSIWGVILPLAIIFEVVAVITAAYVIGLFIIKYW